MAAVLVEQRHSVAIEVHPRRRVDGRAWHAHLPSLRELRVRLRVLVVTSSESLSTAGLSRCPRTVLKAQLLLFATCKGEANALRKSRLRDELLLVKAQLRVFHGTVAGERSDEVQLVQVEAVLVVGVSTACSAVVIS